MTAAVEQFGGEPAGVRGPGVRGLGVRALLWTLHVYRTAISPLRPPACRYTPSCSAYAEQAVATHGATRGTWLAVRRLLRCHPFHRGGHDPVPPRVGHTAGAEARACSPAEE